MAEATDTLATYRLGLIAAAQKAQEDFDKTILALSGGALGISFTFLKDVIGPEPIDAPYLLITAWVTWALSTLAVLSSYHLSNAALRYTIKQVDDETIRTEKAGGWLSTATASLNAIGALLFVVGVLSITGFAAINLKSKGTLNVAATKITTTKEAASPECSNEERTSEVAGSGSNQITITINNSTGTQASSERKAQQSISADSGLRTNRAPTRQNNKKEKVIQHACER